LPSVRRTRVLKLLGVAASSWYRPAVPAEQHRRRGPAPKPVDAQVEPGILAMAKSNPWYGYKRIAVMGRREGQKVTNRDVYRVMKAHGLLHKRRRRPAELYQARKLFELLPSGPNELWQMDVTYVHIPGYGWWYAVTVIDYYSRYLLAVRLTFSYSAGEVIAALQEARAEAERLCGPLSKPPFLVTDNGSSFIARRFGEYVKDHFAHVRIQYRTPTQLGLLERFHQTFKDEEVYWRMYDDPRHAKACFAEFKDRYNQRRPHWALVPETGQADDEGQDGCGGTGHAHAPSSGGNGDANAAGAKRTGCAAKRDPVTPHDVYVGGVKVTIPKWQNWAKAARARLDQMMAA
jgi:putative transposase